MAGDSVGVAVLEALDWGQVAMHSDDAMGMDGLLQSGVERHAASHRSARQGSTEQLFDSYRTRPSIGLIATVGIVAFASFVHSFFSELFTEERETISQLHAAWDWLVVAIAAGAVVAVFVLAVARWQIENRFAATQLTKNEKRLLGVEGAEDDSEAAKAEADGDDDQWSPAHRGGGGASGLLLSTAAADRRRRQQQERERRDQGPFFDSKGRQMAANGSAHRAGSPSTSSAAAASTPAAKRSRWRRRDGVTEEHDNLRLRRSSRLADPMHISPYPEHVMKAIDQSRRMSHGSPGLGNSGFSSRSGLGQSGLSHASGLGGSGLGSGFGSPFGGHGSLAGSSMQHAGSAAVSGAAGSLLGSASAIPADGGAFGSSAVGDAWDPFSDRHTSSGVAGGPGLDSPTRSRSRSRGMRLPASEHSGMGGGSRAAGAGAYGSRGEEDPSPAWSLLAQTAVAHITRATKRLSGGGGGGGGGSDSSRPRDEAKLFSSQQTGPATAGPGGVVSPGFVPYVRSLVSRVSDDPSRQPVVEEADLARHTLRVQPDVLDHWSRGLRRWLSDFITSEVLQPLRDNARQIAARSLQSRDLPELSEDFLLRLDGAPVSAKPSTLLEAAAVPRERIPAGQLVPSGFPDTVATRTAVYFRLGTTKEQGLPHARRPRERFRATGGHTGLDDHLYDVDYYIEFFMSQALLQVSPEGDPRFRSRERTPPLAAGASADLWKQKRHLERFLGVDGGKHKQWSFHRLRRLATDRELGLAGVHDGSDQGSPGDNALLLHVMGLAFDLASQEARKRGHRGGYRRGGDPPTFEAFLGASTQDGVGTRQAPTAEWSRSVDMAPWVDSERPRGGTLLHRRGPGALRPSEAVDGAALVAADEIAGDAASASDAVAEETAQLPRLVVRDRSAGRTEVQLGSQRLRVRQDRAPLFRGVALWLLVLRRQWSGAPLGYDLSDVIKECERWGRGGGRGRSDAAVEAAEGFEVRRARHRSGGPRGREVQLLHEPW